MGHGFETSARALHFLAQKSVHHSSCHTADGGKPRRTNNVTSCWFRLHRRLNFTKLCRIFFVCVVSYPTTSALSQLRFFSVHIYRGDSQHVIPTYTYSGSLRQYHMDCSCRSSPRLAPVSKFINCLTRGKEEKQEQACQTRRQRRKFQVYSTIGRIGRGYWHR